MATLLFVGAHPDDESFGPGGTLAEYALRGHRVIYACATRGEAGSADAEFMAGFDQPGDLRWAELTAAARELGLAEVIYLGYRDSGMPGSEANAHPEAQINAPLDEVAERVVAVIRRVRADVVITFDPIGGYRHPDHIHIHQATVRAFAAAGDAAQYPATGPAFTPRRLYFTVFPKGLLKLAVRVLPLVGRDPRKFGRNGDINLVDLASEEFPVHCRVPLSREAQARKERAAACHRSQLAGGPQRGGWLVRAVSRLFGASEPFMRAQPPVPAGAPISCDLLAP
jgi:N-acetyl-1-D-myo-inositol-2-amino-2-deoxy-alpha-D-glucopyranoside deacetylase/mycothiol S-conjugate amidase